MTTDILVLDYAARRPRGAFFAAVVVFAGRALLRTGRWCLRNRHHLCAIGATLVATSVVVAATDARVVLNAPVYGGCGAARSVAYGNVYLTGWALWLLPLLWLGSRRSIRGTRLAGTAAVVAGAWWLYMRFPMYGPRLFL